MRRSFAAAAALLAFSAGLNAAAGAGPTPILLELFTSEGCSSCPPADDLLQRLERTQPARGARLIVLSEHIDYWNALGWKDPFSSPQFTARQSSYAARIDPSGGVFTPELVVDGREGVVGSDARAVSAAIDREAAMPKLAMALSRPSLQGSAIRVRVTAGAPQGPARLYVAIASDRVESNVTAGENAGRTLAHVSVVRALVTAGTFTGSARIEKQLAIPMGAAAPGCGLRIVAFLQDVKTQAILAAAQEALPALSDTTLDNRRTARSMR